MAGELITIFGGSGFLGRYVVRDLCRKGYRVRVAVRNPHLAGDMRVGGDVGQVQLVQVNVRNRPSIERALEGASGVINLVGILFERGAQTFNGTQEIGAGNVAELAKAAGVTNYVQMSALGADAEGTSRYAQTKARAEAKVAELHPDAVILRPSLVFGPEDGFFNKFADMARYTPTLPSIGGGETKFQPVFVGDVSKAIIAALEHDDAKGKIFELGGPKVYSFKELLTYITSEIDRPRWLLPLPFFLAKMIGLTCGTLFKLWPFHQPPLTADQVELLKTDNIVSGEHGTIEDLGLEELESVEAIVPTYLWRYRTQGQFHEMERT